MTNKPNVLLTSVIRPFGGPGEGASVGAELFHAQVTRAQKGYSLRQVIRVWGLDLIAQNITAPAVVLHYPSLAELEQELKKRPFDYVGINFVVATFHKVRAMVQLIRRVSPNSRVILGGYGTVLGDDILRPFADYICREEGVTFMRKLLQEDTSSPIHPAHSPVPSTAVLGYQQSTVVGHVAAGLGCANGCDFCCTSHFFRRKHVRLVPDGYALYEAMMETQAKAKRQGYQMQSWAIIDEDFFLYKKRAEQFLDAVRKGGKSLSLLGFGSIKGLSQFTPSEIAEMGFDLIWTAFEGKESGYEKLQGRPIAEVYSGLRKHGVAVLSSMILGFPYQDEPKIWAEFAELMSLEPALCQFLIYFAFPGTPLFEQVAREKRFLPQYQKDPDLRRWDGFALHLKHPHFAPARLEELQAELYRQDYARLGPSLYRLARVWLSGYEQLHNSSNPLLRARADRLRAQLSPVRISFAAAPFLLKSDAAIHRAKQLQDDLLGVLGKTPLWMRLATPFVVASGLVSETLAQHGILQQPGLLRVTHRLPDHADETSSVFALQGKGKPLWSRLLEDLNQRAIRPIRDHFLTPSDPAVLPISDWEGSGQKGIPKTYFRPETGTCP